MVNIPPVIEKDGKKVFVGKEDPTNPPVFVRSPLMRYCKKCRGEFTNDKTDCDKCHIPFDDNKMQCQKCKNFFDYLVGDNVGDGKQGCEACWKPPTRKVEHEQEEPTKDVFD